LLVSAHYRTRPSDLRTLMDGANVRTFVLRQQGAILAVAMLAQEGGLPAELATAIVQGKRRPHGQVLAQSLAVHLNVQQALELSNWRVVRIAVHSQWQRQGLGRLLLAGLQQQAAAEGIPLLGSLFAASADVLAFWQQCGFTVVRVGMTAEATSGACPVLVTKAVNQHGEALVQQARTRFEQVFLPALADVHGQLPPALLLAALGQVHSPTDFPLHRADRLDLQQFLAGHKPGEQAALALWKYTLWLSTQVALSSCLDPREQTLLVGKILQKQPWPQVIAAAGYVGNKDARAALQQLLVRLYRQFPLPGAPDLPG
jgi:tRNA(Met) cytidine acetyltransferase